MSFLQEDLSLICADQGISWKKLRESVLLVTGATGLIGSVLVKALLKYNALEQAGIRIYALVRSPEKARIVYREQIKDSALHYIFSDVTEPFSVPEKVDFIIHGASITASRLMVSNPVDTLMTSITGTRNLLDLAQRDQIKGMVYISSMEVYGVTDPNAPKIVENNLGYIDILSPRSSYSEGKRICECMCSAYHAQYGVPVRIARLAQTFGAGVSKSDNRVFAQFAKSAFQGKDIVLHTKGESYGNYCYTADVVRALLCLLTKGESGQAYTVVNETTTMPIRDMAQMVAEKIAKNPIRVIFDIPENVASMGYAPDSTMKLSSEKIRSLGWEPSIDLENMYRRMIADWEIAMQI